MEKDRLTPTLAPESVSSSPPPAMTDFAQHISQHKVSNTFRDKDGGIYRIIKEKPDGNCLLRAFARHVYKDPKQHPRARLEICNAMQQLRNNGYMDESFFTSETIEEDNKVVLPDGLANDFTASTRHISSMRANKAYGGDPEICAGMSCYNVQVNVVDKTSGSVRVMDDSKAKGAETLHVLFGHSHYDTLEKLHVVDQDLLHLSQSLSNVGLPDPKLRISNRSVDRVAIKAYFSLSFDERVRLLEIFTEGNAEDEVVAKPQILRKDILTLRNGVWINDEIVNMCGSLIESLAKDKGLKVCILPSFFWSKLTENKSYSYDNVKKWIKKRGSDITALEMLIMPINHSNCHWSVVVINMKLKKMFALDSVSFRVDSKKTAYFNHLLHFLEDALRDLKMSFTRSEWKWEAYDGGEIPSQSNSFDCGLFTIRYMKNIAVGAPFDFQQEDMTWFRFNLALRMLMMKPTL
jgi:sentrin-specific protease 1